MSQVHKLANDKHIGQRFKPAAAVPANNNKKYARQPSLKKVDPHLVSLTAPESVEAEQYRMLRYEVEHLHKKEGLGTVVGICSALPGDGKTTTAINLAGTLAQDAAARVLLVEVDLRRPGLTVGDQLALGNFTGLGLVDAILDSSLTLKEVVHHVPHFNLSILPAGRQSRSPYEMLNSPRFGKLLTQACERYDYLILDSPPVIPVPDCRLIADWVDGFVMVVAAHRTPREALEEALTLMHPSSVLGLVFNGYKRSSDRYYGYSYGHE